MSINSLTIGKQLTLDQVLLARERRVEFQEKLARLNQGKVLIAFKLNIPGPVKNNTLIRSVFSQGLVKIKKELCEQGIEVFYEKDMDERTGPEAFMITEGGLKDIKQLMVKIEENSPTGRLYDLDVMTETVDGIVSISREDLDLPQRTCLVCGNLAKACGRNRTHSVETLQEKIYSLILDENP